MPEIHDNMSPGHVLLSALRGVQYVVEGPLVSPDGRDPAVRSVWVIEHQKKVPRLVTAYPLPRPRYVV